MRLPTTLSLAPPKNGIRSRKTGFQLPVETFLRRAESNRKELPLFRAKPEESNGIGSQAGSWGVEAALRFSGLSIWFIRITSLRITATSATFGFLPAARSRW